MTQPTDRERAAAPDGTPAIGTNAKRVLLVEDDRFQRTAVEAALRQQGFDVTIAVDGEEALRLLAETDRPDLVLLDLIMPKVSGFEVLRRMKQDPATAHIRVLVLSNLGQKGDVEQAAQAGATAYLVKAKVTLRELVERVKAELGQGQG
jgi:two-component system phosphate regulon response regulator PhoB